MTYSTISARRIPYDLDGTTVGYRTANDLNALSVLFGQGVATELTGSNLGYLNGTARSLTIGGPGNGPKWGVWFFFPELRDITRIGFLFPSSPANSTVTESKIQGSADSTNGIDGTWIDATYTLPTQNLSDADNWRDNTFAVSFASPIKVLRIGQYNSGSANVMAVNAIHLYGTKATGETTNDLIFTNTSGTELTALKDWGDRPEGSTATYSIKVKNVGTSTCTGITITSSNTTLTMSWSASTGFTNALTIASLGADSLSDTIYIKHTLGAPPLILGPVAARIYITGTWS